MRATMLFVSIMALCLLLIPMIAINSGAVQQEKTAAPSHAPITVLMEETPPPLIFEDSYAEEEYIDGVYEEQDTVFSNYEAVASFKILDQSTGRVREVPLQDFLRGAVAAEMPASFHIEAMKAQAVAAHTFALHNHIQQLQSPDPALKGADFAADPSNMKVYVTEETARAFYGEDNAEFYWNKICEAADSVADYILEYDGEPIVAAYHAISAGATEDASNVWTGSAPYLQSVDSEGDLLAPGYESAIKLTADDVEDAITAAYPGAVLEGEPSEWFGAVTRSGAGYVTEIEVGGMLLHGKEIREMLGLRSHNFTIEIDDGDFVFTVAGYGHGVGLSQYGADFMARQGAAFDEILSAYYTDATLTAIELD